MQIESAILPFSRIRWRIAALTHAPIVGSWQPSPTDRSRTRPKGRGRSRQRSHPYGEREGQATLRPNRVIGLKTGIPKVDQSSEKVESRGPQSAPSIRLLLSTKGPCGASSFPIDLPGVGGMYFRYLSRLGRDPENGQDKPSPGPDSHGTSGFGFSTDHADNLGSGNPVKAF